MDAISNVDGLPGIESMIGKSVVEVLKALDSRKLLMAAFRASLSRLKYGHERTSEGLREQVICVMSSLELPSFMTVVSNLLESLIPNYTGETSGSAPDAMYLMRNIDSTADRDLQLAGTFQSALYSQILTIVSSLFAVVLAHADRNCTLQLLFEEQWTETWLYLFQASFNGSSAVSLLKQKSENMKAALNRTRRSMVSRAESIEMRADGFDNSPFQSKFPFSFYISAVVDSMRKVTELTDEEHLMRQFETAGIVMGITEDLTDSRLNAYIYDFMSMRCKSLLNISRSFGDLRYST